MTSHASDLPKSAKTALVVGATGVVGRELVHLLCAHPADGHERLPDRLPVVPAADFAGAGFATDAQYGLRAGIRWQPGACHHRAAAHCDIPRVPVAGKPDCRWRCRYATAAGAWCPARRAEPWPSGEKPSRGVAMVGRLKVFADCSARKHRLGYWFWQRPTSAHRG